MKKIIALIITISLLLPFSVAALEDYPHSIWAPLDKFAAALSNGNDEELYKYGLEVINIMENQPDSHLKKEFLAGKYEQVSRCAERLGLYSEAVSLHKKYLPYGEYMGWADGVAYSKKKIYLLSSYLDVYIKDKNYTPPFYNAKFEPQRGVYFGSVYDNDDRILDFNNSKILKYFPKQNSTFLIYLEFGDNPRELGRYNRYLNEAVKNNVAVEFAWNTYNSLENLDEYKSYIKDTIDFLSEYKTKIFLRFGAEMNIGANGNNKEAYKSAFRYVSQYAKTKDNIAVVWSPHDLSSLDRSYGDYYPGDEYVDWIGASLYVSKYFEGKKDHGTQTDPLNTYFSMDEFAHPVNRITELMNFLEVNNINKPVMIAECGASHYVRTENEDLTDWAKVQLRRIYSDLLIRYPRIKMINYFNVKMENEVNAYELYTNSTLNSLYNNLVASDYFLSNTASKAPFGYRYFDGGETDSTIEISAVSYYPKTLYNSVKYYLDGNFEGELYDTPFDIKLSNIAEGKHTLYIQLIDNGIIRLEKTIDFNVKIPISIILNKEKIEFQDQQPVIINDRTLVPVRGIFEKMGMAVNWNEANKEVTIKNARTNLTLAIGNNILKVNGKEILMDVPAQTINDRTMIPLRAVSEAINAEVSWNQQSNTVNINY